MEFQNEDNVSSNDEYGSENISEISFASENENQLMSPKASGNKTFQTAMHPEDLTPKLRAFLEQI